MLPYRRARALRIEEFRVRLEDHPGWVWGTTRVPQEGEDIFCAAGLGTVTAVHGKTGNGSRLVQIGLGDTTKHPFFAAASNVLLRPVGAAAPAVPRAVRDAPPVPAEREALAEPDAAVESDAPAGAREWLGGSGNTLLLG